jgi:hypothetical protein
MMKCESCSKVYIGQTDGSFKVRFKEHMSDIVHNREKTCYSHHVLNSGHERAHNITQMEILDTRCKSPDLNTLENSILLSVRRRARF